MGQGFLFVFMLALFGNVINIAIYNSDQIRFYIAIRMLSTKLVILGWLLFLEVPGGLKVEYEICYFTVHNQQKTVQ